MLDVVVVVAAAVVVLVEVEVGALPGLVVVGLTIRC